MCGRLYIFSHVHASLFSLKLVDDYVDMAHPFQPKKQSQLYIMNATHKRILLSKVDDNMEYGNKNKKHQRYSFWEQHYRVINALKAY